VEKFSVPFNREQALEKLGEKVGTDWLIKHCIAAGAVMRAVAERLGGDPDAWEVLGIMHDVDFDVTKDDPARHTMLAGEWLREWGFDETAVGAVLAHNEMAGHGLKRNSTLELALSASESITGLVVATALVMPDKKLAGVKPSSVQKRMKEKAFARKVSREEIMQCEQIGIPIAEFCEIAVKAMQGVSDQLAL
jgi:putative nucleotidyltransferase with HDIG domain